MRGTSTEIVEAALARIVEVHLSSRMYLPRVWNGFACNGMYRRVKTGYLRIQTRRSRFAAQGHRAVSGSSSLSISPYP
ncbi:hypothetical protein G3N95_15965 [Paraburkholderia sp. Tr-20389]|uniref:hypothetical protein n=1 Tax=Paraburkholderia sp. Tr-20389 TaxID=2703903 RepID=UPI00197FFA4A|nr:hypothetical protein [Paraburkholderia sp. Tr-20389]MBN3754446.1 hypothetical protein [Paraburkholderia sp. Tr-20389]